MTEFDIEDFNTKATRRIDAIHTADDYSRVSLWLTGTPEWRSLPDNVAEPLLQALEEQRRQVLRKSGALIG